MQGTSEPWLTPASVIEAKELAAKILVATPTRLRHTAGVASRAEFLTATVAEESATTLVVAAWLHDIGYAEELRDTGFHPVDGARYLQRSGWPPEVCNLVAHHSGARFLAGAAGLDSEIGRYDFSVDPLSDALTVADQSTGPQGELMTIGLRLADQLRRHGPDSPYARAYPYRGPYVRSCVLRTIARLERTQDPLGFAAGMSAPRGRP
ncbi:MAG TPA: HD domain-containing protein [Microlunatus sp.]